MEPRRSLSPAGWLPSGGFLPWGSPVDHHTAPPQRPQTDPRLHGRGLHTPHHVQSCVSAHGCVCACALPHMGEGSLETSWKMGILRKPRCISILSRPRSLYLLITSFHGLRKGPWRGSRQRRVSHVEAGGRVTRVRLSGSWYLHPCAHVSGRVAVLAHGCVWVQMECRRGCSSHEPPAHDSWFLFSRVHASVLRAPQPFSLPQAVSCSLSLRLLSPAPR